MIWRLALPGSRIVHAIPRALKGGDCERVWSNKAVDDIWGNPPAFVQPLTREWEPAKDDEDEAQYGITVVEEAGNDDFFRMLNGDWQFGTSSASMYLGEDHQIEYPMRLRGFCTPEPTPTLLLACRESHDEAIRVCKYTKAFGDIGVEGIWFSFELDTLYIHKDAIECLNCTWTLRNLGDDIDKVQNLALGTAGHFEGDPTYQQVDMDFWADVLSYFGGVKHISFVRSYYAAGSGLEHIPGLELIPYTDIWKGLETCKQPYTRAKETKLRARATDLKDKIF